MKWEYFIVYAGVSNYIDRQASVEELNALGLDGWEAINAWLEPKNEENVTYVLLKRPLSK